MTSKTYTYNELKATLPPELMEDLSEYLTRIDAEQESSAWGFGFRRIPHA